MAKATPKVPPAQDPGSSLGAMLAAGPGMNKKIVIATLIIGGSGIVNSITRKKPITPVIIGSFVFMLVLSIADAVGGPLSTVAGGLAMVAMVYVLVAEFPWDTVLKALKGTSTAPGVGKGKSSFPPGTPPISAD